MVVVREERRKWNEWPGQQSWNERKGQLVGLELMSKKEKKLSSRVEKYGLASYEVGWPLFGGSKDGTAIARDLGGTRWFRWTGIGLKPRATKRYSISHLLVPWMLQEKSQVGG